MPDDDVIDRMKPKLYVRDARAADSAREGHDAKLPGLADPYQAAGLAEHNEVSRLVLVMGKDGFTAGGVAYHFLQYVHISRGGFGFYDDGQRFTFLWSDLEPKQVTVRGRNLLRICDYISLRRMPWIRVADRDFRAGAGAESEAPIITGIEIVDWKPKRKPAAQVELEKLLEAAVEDADGA
jgi:hypothetical protein